MSEAFAAGRGRFEERAVPELIAAVRSRWERDLAQRHIDIRTPFFRWTAAQAEEPHHPATSLAGGGAMADLVASIHALPRKRLLILGEPGTGKSTAAAILVLSLLDARDEHSPIPVLLPLASWNVEEQPFEAWLVSQLAAEYPALSHGLRPAEQLRRIVAEQRLLPVLDGLDELPGRISAKALGVLEAALDRSAPLILTCRTSTFEHLDTTRVTELLSGGGIVTLQPPLPEDLIAYLRTDSLGPQGLQRMRLADAISAEPTGPIAVALRNPLLLALALRLLATNESDVLSELQRFSNTRSAERYLTDVYLASATEDTPDYTGADILRWLSFLAASLKRRNLTALTWWSIADLTSLRVRYTVRIGLLGIIVPVWFLGLVVTLEGLVGDTALLTISPIAAGVVPLLCIVEPGHLRVLFGRSPIADPESRASTAVKRTALAAGVGGVLAACVVGTARAFAGDLDAYTVIAGLTIAVLIGMFAAMRTQGFTYLLSVGILALTRSLPLRVDRFLREAHKRSLLVAIGPRYQFRHSIVQDKLADQWSRLADDRDSHLVPAVRLKVVQEALVHPAVLAKLSSGQTPEAVRRIAADVLESHMTAVVDSAADQYHRYESALKQLSDATLPRFIVPARVHKGIAWTAGVVAAWTTAMYFLPGSGAAVLMLVLVGVIASWTTFSAISRTPGRREGRSTALRPVTAIGLTLPLLIGAGAAVLSPSDWIPGSRSIAVAGICACLAVFALMAWPWSSDHETYRRLLTVHDPSGWSKLPSSVAGYRAPAEQAHRDWIGALVRKGLIPLLRVELGDTPDSMSPRLPAVDTGRLGGEIGVEDLVGTDSGLKLMRLLSKLESASIGLSGQRGAGKSTLLRQVCSTAAADSVKELRLLVHAPTAYDPKDFIAHLFQEVCESITGTRGRWQSRRLRTRWTWVVPVSAVLTGAGLIAWWLQWRWIPDTAKAALDHFKLLVGATGILLIVLGVAGSWLFSRRARRRSGTSAAEITAREHLQALQWLRSTSQTHSGEMPLPGGGKLGAQSTLQKTETARSYPQLVSDLRDLLEQIGLECRATGGRVIIGIDELDKIGSAEAAERFLNDLKVIFGVRGCYFLVALSEDALAGFERRSLAIRNTFDSAFDQILHVRSLNSPESVRLLASRGISLPLPFLWLCQTISGGLPRDLLRSVTELTNLATEYEETDLSALATRLIWQDLQTIIAAQLRSITLAGQGDTIQISAWLAKCATSPVLSGEFDALANTAPLTDSSTPEAVVITQTHTYLRVLAALTKIFVENPSACLDWLRAEGEPTTIDHIATVRGLLATDPQLALHTIDRIREYAPLISVLNPAAQNEEHPNSPGSA